MKANNYQHMDSKILSVSYQHCKNITRTYAKTFYLTSHFLPSQKKRAAYSVYAFCRYIDDLIDKRIEVIGKKKLDPEDIQIAISNWRNDLKSVYNGEYIDHPIMIAWKDTLSNYNIPETLPNELIDGVIMDLTIKRYENFESLHNYCYKVASVVGLMTMEIFGYEDSSEAQEHAIDMGIAMQLTNILRDVKEDAEKNRIYIPISDLREFNYSEEKLFNFEFNKEFKELMQFQIDRANKFYDKADNGIKLLKKDTRITVGLMSKNYRKILNEIKLMDYNVYKKRAIVPFYKKFYHLPELFYKYKFAA